jgi:hypothetical protein
MIMQLKGIPGKNFLSTLNTLLPIFQNAKAE